MIECEITGVWGFEGAIRGMRNPMNSWDRSDSYYLGDKSVIGQVDETLMLKLIRDGTEHRKFMRMIHIQADITAPLYWFKEFDTYKVGTTANSCSTMHKLASRNLQLGDFSYEHLNPDAVKTLQSTIFQINRYRDIFNETGDKEAWWQMIQLLPSSYNQKRTVDLNYEVAMNIIWQRRNHKQDEWRHLCEQWLEELPYMKIFMEAADDKR